MSTARVMSFGGGAHRMDVERIGRVGEFWATRYSDGWTVYGFQSGATLTGATREQAEDLIALYEQSTERKAA